mgnify:CR=1 FL=1
MALQRLDKVIASTGRWSRREVKELVRQGRITVNGAVAKIAEEKADPEAADICVNGERLIWRQYTWVMLNKPAGYLSATEDGRGKTVLDLLPPELQKQGLFPVGRLDKDTTGLLLLTTDGELNHRLLAPARHVDKTYLATLDKPVGEKEAAAFASGLSLSDFEAAPADLTPLPGNQARVTIHEGKFHQVKRMFAAVEREVLTLHRETFGSLVLDEALPCGQWRELTEAEASALYRDAQMEEKHG